MSADGRAAAARGRPRDRRSDRRARHRARKSAEGTSRRTAPFGILQSGPGPERAARAATAALAAGAHALVSWGLAGGLAADLAPGAVVLPRRVRAAAGGSFDADPAWHAALERALRAEFAPRLEDLVTVPAALTAPRGQDRRRRARRDRRGHGVGRDRGRGARARAPFVALRVIVDAAGDSLPRDAERWIDERGERRLAPALAAAFRPAQWRGLWILAQRYRAARGTLERVAALVAANGFALPEPAVS